LLWSGLKHRLPNRKWSIGCQIENGASVAKSENEASIAKSENEASIAKSENESTTDQSDVNATIYSRLFYIHRSADIVAKLRKRLRVDQVDTCAMLTTYNIVTRHRYTATTAMFWHAYFKYRIIAIRYDHPQYLRGAYNLIHDSTPYELKL
jgi:hypothetical protein